MTKWIRVSTLAILLAGCSHAPSNVADRETKAYLHHVQSAITHNFGDTRHYAGKRCLVTAQRRADGRYSVLRTEGDEALCLKAWQSVSSARNLPLPPKNAPEQLMIAFPPAN